MVGIGTRVAIRVWVGKWDRYASANFLSGLSSFDLGDGRRVGTESAKSWRFGVRRLGSKSQIELRALRLGLMMRARACGIMAAIRIRVRVEACGTMAAVFPLIATGWPAT